MVGCPIDEMNGLSGRHDAAPLVPPSEQETELSSCRKFAPTARNYAAARLMADVGLRVNEARSLDLPM